MASDNMLEASVQHADNALWNYVSLIVWLRTMRRIRGVFGITPVVFGGLGSWKIITDVGTGQVPLLASGLAFLAGVIPIVYMATRIEDNILNGARIAGRYRVVEARFRDFVLRYPSVAPQQREEWYTRLLEELLQLKSEAHTVPRWCYKKAKKLIAAGEYDLLSSALAKGVSPPAPHGA